MADGPAEPHPDPKWPQLISLSAHELRSPLTVVAGYVRMLLQERAGPLSDQQRRLLQEAEKSCGRMSALLAELSELSQLESGTAPFNRSTVDLPSILADAIRSLPDLPDRSAAVVLTADAALPVLGDASRLRSAFSSVLQALRRELVADDRLFVQADPIEHEGGRSVRITIGDPHRLDGLRRLAPAAMTAFDEWRGGNGLALPNARRVIEAHGGRIWSPAEGLGGANGKAGAIIILPLIE